MIFRKVAISGRIIDANAGKGLSQSSPVAGRIPIIVAEPTCCLSSSAAVNYQLTVFVVQVTHQ